nr:hypothetical protein Q903MT_gene2066 [Picea sitchensis]
MEGSSHESPGRRGWFDLSRRYDHRYLISLLPILTIRESPDAIHECTKPLSICTKMEGNGQLKRWERCGPTTSKHSGSGLY